MTSSGRVPLTIAVPLYDLIRGVSPMTSSEAVLQLYDLIRGGPPLYDLIGASSPSMTHRAGAVLPLMTSSEAVLPLYDLIRGRVLTTASRSMTSSEAVLQLYDLIRGGSSTLYDLIRGGLLPLYDLIGGGSSPTASSSMTSSGAVLQLYDSHRACSRVPSPSMTSSEAVLPSYDLSAVSPTYTPLHGQRRVLRDGVRRKVQSSPFLRDGGEAVRYSRRRRGTQAGLICTPKTGSLVAPLHGRRRRRQRGTRGVGNPPRNEAQPAARLAQSAATETSSQVRNAQDHCRYRGGWMVAVAASGETVDRQSQPPVEAKDEVRSCFKPSPGFSGRTSTPAGDRRLQSPLRPTETRETSVTRGGGVLSRGRALELPCPPAIPVGLRWYRM
ncbi:unnamed protein product [Arctogadus glacialis]